MQQPDYGRVWEYRFYDDHGLITVGGYAEGLAGRYDSDEMARRASERFADEHGITVTRIERQSGSGTRMAIPVR